MFNFDIYIYAVSANGAVYSDILYLLYVYFFYVILYYKIFISKRLHSSRLKEKKASGCVVFGLIWRHLVVKVQIIILHFFTLNVNSYGSPGEIFLLSMNKPNGK